MAVEELSDRLSRLEQKLDRLDGQLRRSTRLSATVPTLNAAVLKKKSSKSRKPATPKALPKKPRLAEVTKIKRIPPVLEEVVLSQPEPLAPAAVTAEPQTETSEEIVVLIQADEATRRVARDYFGPEVRFLELSQVQELPALLEGQRVLAVIFDRMLWGDAAARASLEDFRQHCPDAKLVGLSSYLTLAFAESMLHREDAATFLTRPLSLEALSGIFQQGAKEAIS